MADKQVSGLTSSTPTIDDLTISYDNADTSELKKTTWQLVRDLFKTYFDTIYQAVLVSGTNIKTVNGNSLVGSGDIVISGGGGVTDHGALTGLADDDHTQYTKADGTRAFTGKQSYSSHPTFSADTELVDKKYVDDAVVAGGGYTDEQAQDAVGGILVDSSTIDFTYSDATPSITADIINDSVTFAKVQNISTNRILGRSTAGTGDVEELNVTAIPALIGLGTSDSPQFAGVNVGHATDTTITRVSAGVIAVEGVNVVTTALTGSTTQAGIAEASISSEVNTGTDANRYVSPDSLAGSNLGIRYVACSLNGTTALTTSDKAYFRIPSAFTGMNLVSVSATVGTGASGSSSSGVPTFTVKNVTDGNQMLSTSLTVDASEYTSATAATPAVINASFDDVVTDDLIEVACTVAGTGVTYATILVGFQLP